MTLVISIVYEDTTIEEARTIYNFLKEHAEPYPGMRLHAQIVENEPAYIVPEP